MKASRILAFLAVVMAAVVALGEIIPQEGMMVAGVPVRFASLHTIVEQRETSEGELAMAEVEPTEEAASEDTTAMLRRAVEEGSLRFWLPEPHYLDGFWQRAENARRTGRTVRVLHYGDSQIEMDHITSRLRASLQEQFGGSGPGMLPARSVTPVTSARLSTHGELVHLASFGDSLATRSRGNYGPMMQSFRLGGGTVSITVRPTNSTRVDKRVKEMAHVRLVANNKGNLRAEMVDLSAKRQSVSRSVMERGVGTMEWQADSTYPSGIKLTVQGTADLYAVLVDGEGGGIAVDNIPMRGCSGQQFTLVDQQLLTSAYEAMDVGMIIMQFGGNSVPYIKTTKQIATYCQSLGKQIDYVRACCPGAKIVFVGPSDMSTRVHGELTTYPALPELIDSMAEMATRHGVAYWSIYHAMGGKGSMTQWTRRGLAGSDYIHFSQKGADMMGDMMSEALRNSYRLYKYGVETERRRSEAEQKRVEMEKNKKRKRRR